MNEQKEQAVASPIKPVVMCDVILGSLWAHRNGNKYKVIALANTRTERPKEYPITVVYENINNGAVWCRKMSDWHRSMTKYT